jgi:cytochrome c5
MTKTEFPWIAAAIIVMSGAAVVSATTLALAQNLPDGNGKEVVQTICTGCHDLEPITGSGFTKEDWEIVVKNMIDMGATIKPEEVTLITNYLAANFPPKAKR